MDYQPTTPPPPQPAEQAARRWRASLPREWRRSTILHGGAIALMAAALYVATFLGMFLLPHWALRLACVIVQPVVIGMLFVIGHDATHNSLTPLGWLNRVLGRLVFLPAYHPYTSWAHAHNTLHHGWTNFKGRHPDFPPMTKQEFDCLPLWRRWLERAYRTPLGVGMYYTIDFYAGCLLFPRGPHVPPNRLWFHLDRLFVLAYFAGLVGLSWWLTGFVPGRNLPREVFAVGAVVIPWTSWIWFMGFTSFIQHTHPRMAWYDDEAEWSFYHVQLKSTAHVVFPWPVERLLHNIMDHPAHHLDPTIPLYRLPASQRLLEQTTPEHAMVVRWTPLEYIRTCAACKLYDFERHCWTDFAGVPTTPCNLPDLPEARPANVPMGAPS
jgi:omega-6 fatty acid desaturase (delta-12 desaturase)